MTPEQVVLVLSLVPSLLVILALAVKGRSWFGKAIWRATRSYLLAMYALHTVVLAVTMTAEPRPSAWPLATSLASVHVYFLLFAVTIFALLSEPVIEEIRSITQTLREGENA